ncbi:MAG: hypothetical protein ABIN67_20875 [Ferruginibacter sp.]
MKIEMCLVKQLVYTVLGTYLAQPAICQVSRPEEPLLKQKTAAYTFANKLDSALLFCKILVAKFPGTENYLFLGSVYEIKKDIANADIYYEKAIKSSGDNASKVYSSLAYVSFRRGKFSKAFRYGNMSLGLLPQQPELHYFIGNVYDSLANEDSASYHYSKAYQLDTNNTEYLRKMYNLYYKEGYVRESLTYLEKVINIDVFDGQSKLALANGFIELDEYNKAIKLLKDQIDINAMTDSGYFALAKCYLNLGDTLNGIISLKKAISFSYKPNVAYYDELSHVYADLGQYGAMLEIYQEGSKKGFYNYQQWIQSYKEKLDTMTRIYQVIEQGNANAHLFNLGNLYFAINDFRNCLKVLTDYKLANGKQTDSFFCLLSICYMNLNKNTEAKIYIQEAIKLSPANEVFRALLTLILYRLKSYQEIIDISKNFPTKNKDIAVFTNAVDNYLLFKAYYALGFSKEAAVCHKVFQEQNGN